MGKKAWLVCLLKFCRKSHIAIGGFGIYMIYKTHSSICQAKDIFCMVTGQVLDFIAAHLPGAQVLQLTHMPVWPRLGATTAFWGRF